MMGDRKTVIRPQARSVSGERWDELLLRRGARWHVSIEAWEADARERLASGPRGFIFGGAGSGSTRDANVTAFSRWQLVPRVLAGSPVRDLSVTLFGQTHRTPLVLAPIGVLSIAHEDADLAVAAAAAELGMTFTISTAGSVAMETVTAATPGLSAWFQLYWVNDRDLTASLVERAGAAGYSALVVTVDTPMLGWREADLSNAYSPFAEGHGTAQFVSDPVFRELVGFDVLSDPGRAGVEMMKLFGNPGLGWDELAWLRSLTSLPIVLKGVLHPDDARRALDVGMDGVIVSNHGGRQVDGAVSALDALVHIRDAVPGSFPLLLDGGVRRGADVVKAMALGAHAVLVGRPYVYGLTVGGRAGVYEVLANLLAETDSVLALSGAADFPALGPGAVIAAPGWKTESTQRG